MYEKNSTAPIILFADAPPLDQLCAVTVSFSVKLTQLASKIQPQIIKCRELIFTEPDIIASPAYDRENSLHVILQQSLYKTGRLQNRFQNIGLEASKPCRVTPQLYESCLRYTFLARLAPLWNKSGDWLIQGRDFISHQGYSNSVKSKITVNNDELFFTLEPGVVKSPPLQLSDLDISLPALMEYNNDPEDGRIDAFSILNNWCQVLPSMKKGRIISISRSIPTDSPFKSYKDIKRHWKNTYGYRLPETEEDIRYYQVHFKPLGSTLYTYPEVCLRARNVHEMPRVDPKPILQTFLKDLQIKLPNVCGYHLKLHPKAKFPIPDLLDASQVSVKNKPNLTNRIGNLPCSFYRSQESVKRQITISDITACHSDSVSCDKYNGNTSQLQRQQILNSSGCLGVENITTSLHMSDSSKKKLSCSDGAYDHYSNEQKRENLSMPSTTMEVDNSISISDTNGSPCGQKLIPIFKPKSRISLKQFQFSNAKEKIVPSFSNRLINSVKQSHQKIQDNCRSCVSSMNIHNVMPSVINDQQPSNDSSTEGTSTGICEDVETSKKKVVPVFRNTHPNPNKTSIHQHSENISRANQATKQATLHQLLKPSNTAGMNKPTINKPLTNKKIFCNYSPVSPVVAPMKRKRPEDDSRDETVKKVRTKPQVQESVDVRKLAELGQLNKANAATLASWLEMNGTKCKSKDKKLDMVQKIMKIVAVHTSEA